MLDKIRKRISEKRPRGAKLIKIVAAFSALVWIGAVAAVFVVKHKAKAATEAKGHGGAEAVAAKAGAGHSESGEGADSEATAEGTEAAASQAGEADEGKASANASEGEEHATAGEAAEADAGESHHAEAEAAAGEVGAEASGSAEGEGQAAGGMPTRDEIDALRQVAELQAAAGEMEKAVTPMRRVLRAPTSDANLLSLATDIFLATGNYREALRTAVQVLALRPDDMRTKVQAVEAQYRLGEVEKAMAAAQATVKEHPGELAMLTALGTMEVEMGPSHPGYGKSLQAALKLKPNYPPALYLLGRKAQLEGDYKDAETAFRKVVKLEPQNAKAHGQLGMALYHLGRSKDAEKEYRAELAMNPNDYNTWYNLGELLMGYAAQEGDPGVIQALRTEAMEAYLKALELNADHAQAHFRVGVLLNGNGQYKEAIRHLEAALKLDSRHVPTLVQLSLAFEFLKQPERARAYLTKAYELDPLNKLVLFKLKQWS